MALASGPGLPDAEALGKALTRAGEDNPVARLQAFLRTHPDHAEARRDLLTALGPRLAARLLKSPAVAGQSLDPDTDQRVWGLIAAELDRLYQADAWALLNLNLERTLDLVGVPERSSPLMRSLYQRHQVRLLAALDTLEPSPLMARAAWPPREVLTMAAAELHRQGRWQDLVDLLQPAPLPKAQANGSPQGYDSAPRAQGWELTSPLVEALLRLGRAEEADGMLVAMADAGTLPGPYEMADLARVAQDCGARAWAERWQKNKATEARPR